MVTEVPGVAVVGASSVGFITSLLLVRRGFSVSLFEKLDCSQFITTPHPATQTKQLVLTSRGLNALNEVGLGAEVLQKCVSVTGRALHFENAPTQFLPYGPDETYCNYSISAHDLNFILLQAVEQAGVRVFFNHPVEHIDVEKKILHFYLHADSPFRRIPRLKYTPNKELPRSLAEIQVQDGRSEAGHGSSGSAEQNSKGQSDKKGNDNFAQKRGFKQYGFSLKFSSIFSCDGSSSRLRASLHNVLHSSVGVSKAISTPFGHILSLAATAAPGNSQTQTQQHPSQSLPFDFRSSLDISGSYDTSVPLGVKVLKIHVESESSHSVAQNSDQNSDQNSQNSLHNSPSLSPTSLHIWPRGPQFLTALPNHDGSFTLTLSMPESDQMGTGICWDLITSRDSLLHHLKSSFPSLFLSFPSLSRSLASLPHSVFVDNLVSIGSHQCFPWHFRHHVVLLGDSAASFIPSFDFESINFALESALILFQHLDYFARVKIPSVPNGGPVVAFFQPEQSRKHFTPYTLSKAFSALSSNHKVNTDAVASMSIEHYIQLGQVGADGTFPVSLQIENLLEVAFPSLFLPRSTMISRTLIPCAVIYTLGEVQKLIIKALLERGVAVEGMDGQEAKIVTLDGKMVKIDLKLAKNLMEKRYQPILNKYNVTAHSIRDVTKELVQKALSNNNHFGEAKL